MQMNLIFDDVFIAGDSYYRRDRIYIRKIMFMYGRHTQGKIYLQKIHLFRVPMIS